MSVWDALVGQKRVSAQLKAVAEGDPKAIAQSWLICGSPGAGRSNVARAFAAALESPDRGASDEPTRITQEVLAGTHPDVKVLKTDRVTIGIDEVRDLIETSEQTPSISPWRIIIIEDVDRMLERTTNVLLKEIEEPSAHTIWLLCAPSAQDVLPTIRSRTRVVNLAVPRTSDVADYLVSAYEVEPALASRAARLSQGHIGVAKLYAGVSNDVQAGDGDDETDGGRSGHVVGTLTKKRNPSGVTTGRKVKGKGRGKAVLGRDQDPLRVLHDRDDLVVGVLSLGRASDAVLLAERLIDSAKSQAQSDIERDVARQEHDFRQANGLDDDERIPPQLRSAYNSIGKKDDVKRRVTRRSRDVLDRSINTMASIYRDVSVIQNDAEDAAGLINLENRDAITDLASRLTREGAVQRMDAIATARRRLNGNGNQLLDFEALLCALIV